MYKIIISKIKCKNNFTLIKFQFNLPTKFYNKNKKNNQSNRKKCKKK